MSIKRGSLDCQNINDTIYGSLYCFCYCFVETKSALMLMTLGSTGGHLEMLHHPVVRQIIDEKWKVFVKVRSKSAIEPKFHHGVILP